MQDQAKKYYTVADYLDSEEHSLHKNEYYQGAVYPMSGASANHHRIVKNLTISLGTYLFSRECELFMNDLKIWVKKRELFTYPDIAVVCGTPQFYPDSDDTITNPMIIVDVLSESTQNYDRGEKFVLYRSLPSFKEYILIDQYEQHVEQFVKNPAGKWILTAYDNWDDILKFSALDFQITLKEIYHKVEFKTA